VEVINNMFAGAAAFSQDLCAWTINDNIKSATMFQNTACPNQAGPIKNVNACHDCNL